MPIYRTAAATRNARCASLKLTGTLPLQFGMLLCAGCRLANGTLTSDVSLEQAERMLQAAGAALKLASDFSALYGLVNDTIGPIRGIGKGRLTV